MLTATWWRNTLERAVKTFFQSAVAAITVVEVSQASQVDWTMVLDMALLATILSVGTSIASTPFGNTHTPNLTDEKDS